MEAVTTAVVLTKGIEAARRRIVVIVIITNYLKLYRFKLFRPELRILEVLGILGEPPTFRSEIDQAMRYMTRGELG